MIITAIIGAVFFGDLSLTALAAAPQPPTNFNISATSSCAVELNWTPSVTTNVGYNIKYTTSTPDFSQNVLTAGNTPNPIFEHINLPLNSGWNYSYEVQAVDNSNPSNVSSWVFSNPATTSTPYLSTPTNSTGLTALGTDSGQEAQLNWNSPALSPFGAFEIYSSTDNVTFTKIDTSPSAFGNAYTSLPNLSSSTVHYFKIKSFDTGYGCVPADKLYSAFTTAITLPASPTGLSATYQSLPTPGQVNLSWTGRGGQDHYKIWRATSTNPLTFLTTSASPSITDTGLESNQKYSYQVQSCSSDGSCSDFSNISTVTISDTPQNPTAQIYYTNGTTGNVRISWDNLFPSPPSYNNYSLERSTDNGAFGQIASIAFQDQSISRIVYQDTGLPLAHNYSYRVRTEFNPNTPFSDVVSVNLNLAISLHGPAWATINNNGVGWVNFNSDNEVPAWQSGNPQYSVQVDRNGLMSGEAWAAIDGNQDYGWLSFNKSDLIGCPAGTCEADISSSTRMMSGWARFIAPQETNNANWNGWVSLGHNSSSDTISSSSINAAGNLVGTAWGGNIVGWLGFTLPGKPTDNPPGCDGKCTVSAKLLDQPPVVTNVQITRDPNAWCAEVPSYNITWTYTDPDSDPQQAFDIKVVRPDNSVVTSTAGIVTDYPGATINDPLSAIGSSITFSVQVRATDGIAGYSPWAASVNSTTTPINYYPLVNFSWTPTSTFVTGTVARFVDTTNPRGDTIQSRLWTFNDAVPNSTTTSPAQTIVSKVPLDVTLTETDPAGNSCSLENAINGTGSETGTRRRIFRER